MPRFNGLIQHSFALQNHELRLPFRGSSVKEMVSERFAHQAAGCGGFRVVEIPVQKCERGPACSPLLEHGLTTLDPQSRARFFEWDGEHCKYERPLPNAFSWADGDGKEAKKERQKHWERVVFAKTQESGPPSINDLLVRGCDSGASEAQAVSRMLCELLAARRSMLFGLALANNFVNVTLPYAILKPASRGDSECSEPKPVEPWILQPVVSLIRMPPDGDDFRRMYCLSFFLVPVKGPCFEAREMRKREVKKMVNAGWGLSTCPPNLPRFDVSGPLPRYATRIEPSLGQILDPDSASEDEAEEITWEGLTLRKATEAITYAVALRMAQGSTPAAGKRARQEVGDEVVSSLGNSRVSSATVVDPDFNEGGLDNDEKGLDEPVPAMALPGALGMLMPALAGRVRIPLDQPVGKGRKYRLDRPYIDHGDYAIGVLPSNRCLVVASDKEAQWGRWDSGLMQAGWIAYTVIAAASAIGTMRAISRDLEKVERSDPSKIVAIEHDVAVDLHEIYDLDITWEAYRLRYRRLREHLGITSDYKALHGKLDALYRETSARFEKEAQKGLLRLTAAIVVLSVLILVGTVIVAANG
ncbi:MAG: hypothetical protein QOF13_968 [Solirubrobacterales bacterium]|jgi:hypothetical protein|nr:hypothetical protein [Solirubrobacterales bacterium]